MLLARDLWEVEVEMVGACGRMRVTFLTVALAALVALSFLRSVSTLRRCLKAASLFSALSSAAVMFCFKSSAILALAMSRSQVYSVL